MLTRAARGYAAAGYAVLRFDFAGRGDSDGDATLATLATMVRDSDTALDWCRKRSDAPLILVGLCSGCEIAVAGVQPNLAACVLWSAPVFAALPSEKRKAAKRGENLKAYARKLLRPATWKKILTGQVNTQAVGQAVAGGGGAAHKNVESNEPGQLPPGFRRASMERWQGYRGPIFQVYGTADPITEEAVGWYREHSGSKPEVHLVPGANHSYYNLEWEREVFEATWEWLERKAFK
jgi:alpha-beta hydrolase superfamily lysophospholipase